jgi:hypothetical protein
MSVKIYIPPKQRARESNPVFILGLCVLLALTLASLVGLVWGAAEVWHWL